MQRLPKKKKEPAVDGNEGLLISLTLKCFYLFGENTEDIDFRPMLHMTLFKSSAKL